jgi:tetratricopeptide (TPR) repeat protein
MLRQTRLDVPDRPSEHGEEHAHSPSFAAVLSVAYEQLARGAFDKAGYLVSPYRTWPLARTQRLRQLFILANSAHHRREYQHAIAFCEEAMSLCEVLNWPAEFAQLALLCAEALHNLQLFGPAAGVAADGLSAWLSLSTKALDPSFEINLRDRFSVELFLLGEYEHASQQARAALHLMRRLPPTRQTALRAAALEWTIALLHRWRNDTSRARRQILGALETYERLGSPDELARLRIVTADITLDALVPLGSGIAYHYREDLVRLARTQLELALGTIGDADKTDVAGRCKGLLAHARLSRALGEDEDRLALLESVGKTAEALHDLPLLGQVYTALGDEFGAAGRAEAESQRNCYRRALAVVEGSHAPAYGTWARRSLLRDAEFQFDE